jgi:hypothetical protein
MYWRFNGAWYTSFLSILFLGWPPLIWFHGVVVAHEILIIYFFDFSKLGFDPRWNLFNYFFIFDLPKE